MNTFARLISHCFKVLGFATLLASETAMPALAQSPAYMSCGQLWYARNQIFASEGYCFATPQAVAVFGRGCFSPYGRLNSAERQRVTQFEAWERIKGC